MLIKSTMAECFLWSRICHATLAGICIIGLPMPWSRPQPRQAHRPSQFFFRRTPHRSLCLGRRRYQWPPFQMNSQTSKDCVERGAGHSVQRRFIEGFDANLPASARITRLRRVDWNGQVQGVAGTTSTPSEDILDSTAVLRVSTRVRSGSPTEQGAADQVESTNGGIVAVRPGTVKLSFVRGRALDQGVGCCCRGWR
ncbi:uncharacterized protein B0H64DRAFT_79867 [Chaetomium fimeti]|uniref:Uncharacterized protein n=1 Tax=Chaetomium fimeti TaxID=1854472 RepID=A0AAE0LVR2_9PEZI|nr:hypothetical protein B0H64DRAFT_79867 [Chaetomium fimeti]